MKKNEIIAVIFILLSFVIGICLYSRMPEQMASHWNIKGEVDDYMPKLWGLFLLPIISLVIFLFFILIPKIDPLKKNIEKFKKYFDRLIILTVLFLFYLYLLTIFWSFGIEFNMNRVLSPAFGILFFYCGVLIGKTERNWFIGIRTPWTMSSERVWNKTHRLGGRLFKISGIIAFLGIIFPDYTFFFIFFSVITASVYTIIYSYFEYQKEKQL